VSLRARPEQFGLFRSIIYRYQAGISSVRVRVTPSGPEISFTVHRTSASRVRKRVKVGGKDRATCPLILGQSFGRNNRSARQIAYDAVEPKDRVVVRAWCRHRKVRVRDRVRVTPVLGDDPTKIRCSDHLFVFGCPQLCTYLAGCARANVTVRQARKNKPRKEGRDLVLRASKYAP
jgi:hypothetical protein